MAASNRQMSKKKKEKMRRVKPTDGQTDGPTCHADLYYFCTLRKREREEMRAGELVSR